MKSFDLYEDMPPPTSYAAFDGSANVVSDAFGKVYVRRRKLGAVPVQEDGSSHFTVPGGVPVVRSREQGLHLRLQRRVGVLDQER